MSIPSIIDAVEFRRDQYGLTARDWAFILGISQGHYSEFAHGKRDLPKKSMAKAFEYGVPAAALFQCHPVKHIKHIKNELRKQKREAA